MKTEKTKEMDMLSGELAGKLILFSLPLACSSILQQLFNSADVAVVGRFAGDTALAAVGSCGAGGYFRESDCGTFCWTKRSTGESDWTEEERTYQSYDSYDSDIWTDFGNIADGDWDAGIKECAGIVWNPG